MRSLFGAPAQNPQNHKVAKKSSMSEFFPSVPEFMSRVEGEWFPNLPWWLLKEPMDQITMVQKKMNHPSNEFLFRFFRRDCEVVPPPSGQTNYRPQPTSLQMWVRVGAWIWVRAWLWLWFTQTMPLRKIEQLLTQKKNEKNIFKSVSLPRTLGTILLK